MSDVHQRLMTPDCIMMIVMITVSHILSRVISLICLCRCWSHSEVQAIHKEVPGGWASARPPEARPEVRGQHSPELRVPAARPGQVHRVRCGPRGPAHRDRQARAADGEPRGPRVQAGEETRGEHGGRRGHVSGPRQHLTKGTCWHLVHFVKKTE